VRIIVRTVIGFFHRHFCAPCNHLFTDTQRLARPGDVPNAGWSMIDGVSVADRAQNRLATHLRFLEFSPSSRSRALSSGLIARDHVGRVTHAALECREVQHGD
jgi:hypothetical protein